ncbi:hypothetical protein [Pectobacterium versatile]|uniref:hypothetical protein n=1 Tax=Pectobacterium versatile TaxID=2488639 RepID=UPI001F24AB5B|nr:hypothetical protein [Pectobacterium versatile]
MKYYLETNALRALGGSLNNNAKLLKESYTSTFSLFELTKGIGRSRDSGQRLGVLKSLQSVDLSFIDFMPLEMMELAFNNGAHVHESESVKAKLRDILENTELAQHDYKEIIERYELGTKNFQSHMTMACAVPAPPKETITLSLDEMFVSDHEIPSYFNKLPKDSHPSRFIMEMLKQSEAPNVYRQLHPESKSSDHEILDSYNNALDLFFFANFTYNLKRKSLREAASKNDLLDILHTLYLVDHDNIIVSNDAIFNLILPNINSISVEEYRNML